MATRVGTQARIDWLMAHQELWLGWPHPAVRCNWRKIVEMMKVDGVVSKRTSWKDVNVNNLIVRARRSRRGIE